MLVTWDTGSVYTNQPSLSWQTWQTPEKLYKWYGDRVESGESCKPAEPATGEMIFSGPPFPPKVPQNGEGQFFPPLPQKMPILFHSGNKRQFKLCPKSVSNHQNQLVEAEKLFKKSHIFRLIPLYTNVLRMQSKPLHGCDIIATWTVHTNSPKAEIAKSSAPMAYHTSLCISRSTMWQWVECQYWCRSCRSTRSAGQRWDNQPGQDKFVPLCFWLCTITDKPLFVFFSSIHPILARHTNAQSKSCIIIVCYPCVAISREQGCMYSTVPGWENWRANLTSSSSSQSVWTDSQRRVTVSIVWRRPCHRDSSSEKELLVHCPISICRRKKRRVTTLLTMWID